MGQSELCLCLLVPNCHIKVLRLKTTTCPLLLSHSRTSVPSGHTNLKFVYVEKSHFLSPIVAIAYYSYQKLERHSWNDHFMDAAEVYPSPSGSRHRISANLALNQVCRSLVKFAPVQCEGILGDD